jgi:mycothiol synthase
MRSELTVRPVEDAGEAIEVVRAFEESLLGESRSGVRDLSDWWSTADLAEDSWGFEEDGRLVAFGWVVVRPEDAGAAGFVHPAAQGRGLGTALAERAEQRARERGRTRLQQWAYGADGAARALFESRGYRELRRFREMAIELDGPPPAPEPPDGIEIGAFRESEAPAFHAAIAEAFRGDPELALMPFEEWWAMRRSSEGFDPTLWLVARDGGELAGFCRCEASRRGGGYVALLGVRPAWRRRGLGRALLLHAFGEFFRRGERRVSLGVASDNPTQASRLYEQAGMHVEVDNLEFEKELS